VSLLVHPGRICPVAGGKQQRPGSRGCWRVGAIPSDAGSPSGWQTAGTNTACSPPLAWVKAGGGGGEKRTSKGHWGWKDLSHQLMNFNPWSNVPFPGPGTVSPLWNPRSLCRLRKDLAGKYLTRYLIKFLRFSLTACASSTNTQLKWKLFLFPPFLCNNRKGDQF